MLIVFFRAPARVLVPDAVVARSATPVTTAATTTPARANRLPISPSFPRETWIPSVDWDTNRGRVSYELPVRRGNPDPRARLRPMPVAVDAALLERYLVELGRFGAHGETGVWRTAYSPA